MTVAWHQRHRAERDRLLALAADLLAMDERFVAAWLTGSFGRGTDDHLSDVDITAVVATPFVEILCRRDHQVGAGTTTDRFAILSSISEPALIHENHNNAPSGGSFTDCVYASGVIVDWILVPAATAVRPIESRLLFDSVGIPIQQPPALLTDAERVHRLSEQTAFFWMLVIPTTKVLLRGDLVAFHGALDMLYRIVEEVERLLADQQPRYIRPSRAPFVATATEQRKAIVAACQRMDELAPAIVAAGALVPEARWVGVGPWIAALQHTQ